MKILRRGAEAILYESTIDGQKVLVKERLVKKYRIPQIDARLRLQRTRQEIKIMREARGHGICTPRIVSSDEEKCTIAMERIDGEILKDFLCSGKLDVMRKVGEDLGRLHSIGIFHGDLTTSNIIVKEGKPFFIDFGLGGFSKRIEDMATDLAVLREALESTHHKIAERCWKLIVSGYRRTNPKSDEIFERMEKIEFRARYMNKRKD
jgi:Kae1-associated kinase Bud32